MYPALRICRTLAVVTALVLVAGSCATSSLTSPGHFQGITRIVLRAWEDTRVGLPPLAVTREDSVALVVDFINTRHSGWEDAESDLPGHPLFAELHRGAPVVGRFGFISLRHAGPGYFITDDGGRTRLRAASAAEISAFLAFFGITVEVTPYP